MYAVMVKALEENDRRQRKRLNHVEFEDDVGHRVDGFGVAA
jgi:hypothetical protein